MIAVGLSTLALWALLFQFFFLSSNEVLKNTIQLISHLASPILFTMITRSVILIHLVCGFVDAFC